ncbi:unnamed protein product [Onchocerca flexuosa]|uniref:Uncharacterized protein n=1 Tax=Onchocerca flexuosa TaxID=387005 RepID=A0A183I6K1_9BILA|nr:unnamed protein product [Onchocerca flexuosa]
MIPRRKQYFGICMLKMKYVALIFIHKVNSLPLVLRVENGLYIVIRIGRKFIRLRRERTMRLQPCDFQQLAIFWLSQPKEKNYQFMPYRVIFDTMLKYQRLRN